MTSNDFKKEIKRLMSFKSVKYSLHIIWSVWGIIFLIWLSLLIKQ